MKPAKLIGHHIHPMLIVFPLGLLATSVIFDGVYVSTKQVVFAETAYWNILAGVIGGLLAAVFGFWDWLTIPAKTRAKSVGALHGGINLVVVLLFVWSWLIRYSEPVHHLPSLAAVMLSFVALVFALVAGWLGGELVQKLGVGVASDAGPNAPSSLRSREVRVKGGAAARPSGAMRRRTSP
jgi:uncharacterized membrane protein